MCFRKATQRASSSTERTVEWGSFGPMGKSLYGLPSAPLHDGLGIEVVFLGEYRDRSFRSLYCSRMT